MPNSLSELLRKYRSRAAEAAVAVAVLVFLGVLIWGPSTPMQDVPVTQDAVPEAGQTAEGSLEAVVAADATSVVAPADAVPVPAKKAVSKPLSYDQAVEEYGKFRIQFVNCNGNPGSMSVPVGTKVMLDNRDKVAHTVMVGDRTYKTSALGFALAALTKTGTYPVLCDGGGASVITVN